MTKEERDFEIVYAYKKGQSINSLAKKYSTYPITISRILKNRGVELRHDTSKSKKGNLKVECGDELIEWAKSQGRPVTKQELAKQINRKRLSPSYFIKYPELGRYIVTREQKDLQDYAEKVYKWLQKNDIPYKPNDRTKLGLSLTALLLNEYSNLALQLNIKPKYISKENYAKSIKMRLRKAGEAGITILWLDKETMRDLDSLKLLIETLK